MLLTRRELIQQSAAFAAVACCPTPLLAAQDTDSDRSIRRYLATRAAEIEREFLPGINSAADFESAMTALHIGRPLLGLRMTDEAGRVKEAIYGGNGAEHCRTTRGGQVDDFLSGVDQS